MNRDLIVERILDFSDKYKLDYSMKYNKKQLKQNPLHALDFFFGRVFYGGIWDSVCTRERNIAFNYIKQIGFDTLLEKILNRNFTPQKVFINNLKKRGVSNPRRGKMVYDILNWLATIENHNCVTYSIKEIKNKKISSLFYFFIDEIYFIGEKKASFFLRDLVDFFKLHEFLDKEEYIYVLPIDTYINKFLLELKLKKTKKIAWKNDARIILNWCEEVNISPILLDQGVWYAYANNYKIFD